VIATCAAPFQHSAGVDLIEYSPRVGQEFAWEVTWRRPDASCTERQPDSADAESWPVARERSGALNAPRTGENDHYGDGYLFPIVIVV
jgi:hypothetical protein